MHSRPWFDTGFGLHWPEAVRFLPWLTCAARKTRVQPRCRKGPQERATFPILCAAPRFVRDTRKPPISSRRLLPSAPGPALLAPERTAPKSCPWFLARNSEPRRDRNPSQEPGRYGKL